MLLGLSALLFGTGLLLRSLSVALGGEVPAALPTGVLAALFMVAGCRLWHRCIWALDFLLLGWLCSYVLLTASWQPLGRPALAMPWGVTGVIWVAGLVYLIPWRRRWRSERRQRGAT